jgi:hypothetical protein
LPDLHREESDDQQIQLPRETNWTLTFVSAVYLRRNEPLEDFIGQARDARHQFGLGVNKRASIFLQV